MPVPAGSPLRIALLTYRGKPHCGGQGVYTRHLSGALARLGHKVTVLSGPPYPIVDVEDGVELVELPSLQIYNDHFPMRMPGIWELKTPSDFLEVSLFSAGVFPEPLTFSTRAYAWLKEHRDEFDLVHDNQCLGYGLLGIKKLGLPTVATVHHPITVDRRLELAAAETAWKRFNLARWYKFVDMQSQVGPKLDRIITVSKSSRGDIAEDHGIPEDLMSIVPVGVNLDLFKPRPEVAKVPGRIMTTASADVAMKGLVYLLEAVAKVRTEREVELVLIGKPRKETSVSKKIEDLGLSDVVRFVSGVTDDEIVRLYGEAEVAAVPSLYEGFSLPAIEAMACGVPLVGTTGGAIPEVAGTTEETAILVPPADSDALATALSRILADAELRNRIGEAGRQRVIERFSWQTTAEATVDVYRRVLYDRGIAENGYVSSDRVDEPSIPEMHRLRGREAKAS